jgi:uncharacterized DUF497 family protein
MLFEWDESKRALNLEKRHIDFVDAQRIFDAPVFERTEHRHGEERVVAIGAIEGIEIVVIYVVRGERRRLISARRANCNERQEYQKHLEAIA